MIVKKVKYTDTNKTKVWQIGDLVDYIRYPHNTNPQEKIAHAGSRNFFAATHNGQKVEMIALAQESVHSKMPVSHWVIIPFLVAVISRAYATCDSFIAGVIPPMPMFGRSLL